MPKEILKRGATSNILRVFLQDSTSTTGAGKTALTSASSGLIISTIADLEATATTYTSAATNVETITTLGTFAAPTASKCRFREVDATNFPGVYEIHIADARFAVANSTQLLISIQCTGVAPVFVEYQFVAVDLMDTVRLGLTAIPNFAQGVSGALPTGNATGQVTVAGTASGAITSTSFAAGAITATVIADGAIDAATFTDSALVIGSGVGAGVKAYLGAGSITAGVIADAAIDAATFADSALVIGSGAAAGVKAYLGAGSITAGVVATGAIDADAIASDAITAAKIATGAIDADAIAADAITAAKIATGAIDADSIAADAITSAKIADSAITIRLSSDGTASEGRLFAGAVAGDVWNALVASYTTANSFGARIVRTRSTSPSNEVTITGAFHIAADVHEIQPATITAADFAAGAIDANALATDAVTEIAAGTWTYDISAISLSGQAGRYITDIKIDTSNIASSVTTIEAVAYRQSIADYLLGRNLAGGSDGGRTVMDALRALRNKSEIVGTTLTVYQENDTSSAWTATVSSSASADPVTGIDPA